MTASEQQATIDEYISPFEPDVREILESLCPITSTTTQSISW